MIILPIIVFQSLTSNAQSASPTIHRNSGTGFDYLMPGRKMRSGAKTTADNASRVIGVTDLLYDGSGYGPLDSTNLSYSASRGSVYSKNDFVIVNYDNATSYQYSTAASAYDNYLKRAQTFDANNNIIAYTEQAWVPWIGSGTWRNDYQEMNTYDAMNNLLTNTSQAWDTSTSAWVNSTRTTNTYTAANKLSTSLWENWNTASASWESGFRTTNAYAPSNFPTNSVSESWNTTSSTWDSAYKITYVTNSLGDVSVETAQSYDETFHTWINVSRYTYDYDASRNLTSELYETFDFPTATWQNSSKTLYSGYVGSNASTIVYQSWDNTTSAFINNNKDNYAFNSFEQPTFVYNETWDPSTSTWMRVANSNYGERYQYETYISGVPSVTGINGKAVVYPVPAKDAISIKVTWDEPQAFSVTIADMLGRTINSWEVNETSYYATTQSINDLPAGNYMIKMQGSNGNIVQRFVVEK